MTTISSSTASSAWATMSSNRAAQMQQRMFAKADTNGDGSVDKSELQTMLDKVADKTGTTAASADDVFSKMDADGSGGISASELDAGVKSLMPPPSSTVDFAQQRGGDDGGDDLFAKVDSNGDGSVDASELASMMLNGPGVAASSTDASSSTSATDAKSAALFTKLDTDGDGKLSKSEFEAGKPSGAPPAGGPGGAGGAGGASDASTDPLDTNKDGVVSDAERAAGDVNALMQDIFKAADANGDGTLSNTETSDLKTKVENAIDATLQAMSGSSSSSGSSTSSDSSSGSSSSSSQSSQTSQSQDSAGLAALLDRVLKQYTASGASAAEQAAGSRVATSA